jgi:hypothetical protein
MRVSRALFLMLGAVALLTSGAAVPAQTPPEPSKPSEATAHRTVPPASLAGQWVWRAGGRNFAIFRIDRDRHGRVSGTMERPGRFALRRDFAVDGVSMPAISLPLEAPRWDGARLHAAIARAPGAGPRVEWAFTPARRNVLEMRPADLPDMPPILLFRANGRQSIPTEWDSSRVYPWDRSPSGKLDGSHLSPAAAAVPVAPPPATLGIDPFYRKYTDAGGIPVLGSAKTPDAALRVARATMLEMLAKRPDIRARLVRQGVRVAVLAPDDAITDLPEHRDWKKPARDDPRLTTCELKHYALIEAATDRDYWNARSRGAGGQLTAAGAENLLALPGDRYAGENILVHEFAHAILTAIEEADPKLYAEVQRAYAQAVAAGKWKGDYAGVTIQEYWAEGTQFWFDDNRLARLDDGPIVSHGDLKRYDPQLRTALAKVYRGHRIAADAWYLHPARLNVPLGYKSADC